MSDMKIIDSRPDAPGCCNITGTSKGPFVQTTYHVAFRGLFCPSVRFVEQLADAIGWVPGAAAHGSGQTADAERERLQATILEQEAELEELRELKRAVGITLRDGAVVRGGVISLRERPKGMSLARREGRG